MTTSSTTPRPIVWTLAGGLILAVLALIFAASQPAFSRLPPRSSRELSPLAARDRAAIIWRDARKFRTSLARVAPNQLHSSTTSSPGSSPVPSPLSAAALKALADLQESVAMLDADGVAALAAGHLVEGRAGPAVDLLESARSRGRESSRLLIVLSAAYILRGTPADIVRSLDVAGAAIAQYPSREIQFNYASAASLLLPGAEAAVAWDIYLDVESDPAWRDEARARRDRLQAHTAPEIDGDANPAAIASARSAGSVRIAWYETLLGRWARACLARDAPGLARARDGLHAAAGVVARLAGDRYLTDVAGTLDCGSGDTQVAQLVEEFLGARARYRQDRRDEARRAFTRIHPRLMRAGLPLHLEAELYLQTLEYVVASSQTAFERLGQISERARRLDYGHLHARAEWMRGYAFQDRQDYEAALRSFDRALNAYRRADDADGLVAASTLRASIFDALADYSRAWIERAEALAGIGGVTDHRARYTTLSEAARAALRDGFKSAGLAFAAAAERAAKASGSTLRELEAQLEQARISASKGRVTEARTMLANAAALLSSAADAQANRRTRAAVLSAQSEIDPDPRVRVDLLNRAIDEYRGAGADLPLARLFLAKGRAQLLLHDERGARVSFSEGITIFETVRQTLRDTDFRLSYFEEAWALFDEMIASHIRSNDFQAALAVAVRARARDIDERLAPESIKTSVETLPVPPRTRVLFYVVLEPLTVVWVFSEQRTAVQILPVSRARVQALATDFRDGLIGQTLPASVRERSIAVHDALFAPLSGLLQGADALAIVLDPLLQSIPFTALRKRETDRYLIEDYEVSFWPSLTTVMTRPVTGDDVPSARSTALVVGDPARDDSTSLAPLPGARAEAAAIARIYRQTHSIVGQDALRARFLREAGEHHVVHFAGHALINPELPGLSRLVFASGTAGPNELHAFEIAKQRFTRTQVVVLAGCETAGGRTYRSEGVMSLARAFVAAGVPNVVATLWDIRDDVSQPLFERLHEHLSRGQPVPAALRATQLWSLRSDNPGLRSPAAWSAVLSIAGAGRVRNSADPAVQ